MVKWRFCSFDPNGRIGSIVNRSYRSVELSCDFMNISMSISFDRSVHVRNQLPCHNFVCLFGHSKSVVSNGSLLIILTHLVTVVFDIHSNMYSEHSTMISIGLHTSSVKNLIMARWSVLDVVASKPAILTECHVLANAVIRNLLCLRMRSTYSFTIIFPSRK